MSETASRPTDAARRSFHYRDLVSAGARFRLFGDGMVAASYDAPDENGQAQKLGLADLSPLPRAGFKGPRLAAWLKGQGVATDDASNRATRGDNGLLTARLAATEVIVLGPLDGHATGIAALDSAWSYDAEGVWPVPRRDASFWFLVSGSDTPAMLAKICGVDLRAKSFANHAIAQTLVARTNGIVIRDDIAGTLAFHVLGDSASASFMWTSLLDAMTEFGGRPVGLDALRSLGARATDQ